MIEGWTVEINGALYVQFHQLVIFYDGRKIECGVIGGQNTITNAKNREKIRQSLLITKAKYRDKNREKLRRQQNEWRANWSPERKANYTHARKLRGEI